MQEIAILLKALHELEFLVAYHKHVISSSKCKCDTFMDNLREFYRIYSNMKHLTTTLRNGIYKLYMDNCKMQQKCNLNNSYHQKSHLNKLVQQSATLNQNYNRHKHQQQHQQQQQQQTKTLLKKSLGTSMMNLVINTNSLLPSSNRKEDTKEFYLYENYCLLNENKQNINQQINENLNLNQIYKFRSSSSLIDDVRPINNNRYVLQTCSTKKSECSVIKSNPNTTTIAQAIEETENQIAMRRLQATQLNSHLDNIDQREEEEGLEERKKFVPSSSSSSSTSSNSTTSMASPSTDLYSKKIRTASVKKQPCFAYSDNLVSSNSYYYVNNNILCPNKVDYDTGVSSSSVAGSGSSSVSTSASSASSSPLFKQQQIEEVILPQTSVPLVISPCTNQSKINSAFKAVSEFNCSNSTNSVSSSSASVQSIASNNFNSHKGSTKATDVNTNGQEYEYIRDDESEKRRISKGRVIDELIQTEMDYYKVMKLLYDVYLGPTSETTLDQSQKEAIFCNLKQIMNLSSTLLNDFEKNILNKSFDHVKIGTCFLKNSNIIRQTYAYYAQYIEYSNNILEKNEKVLEVQNFIQNGLNIIKQQTTSAFDLHSLLLKPIQRVLKYPLLLQELIKNTEPFHDDYDDLKLALTCVQDVATYINEIKRRRELIVKYGRKDKDQSSISDKMSKLTLHSMIKKSNRISMKISNVFRLNGISTVDEQFDKLEIRFRYFEKVIKCFTKDSIHHLTNLKEFLKIQTITAESIQEYYSESQSDQIIQYVHINATVLNDIYTKNTNFVHEKVVQPLNTLLKYLEIPNKLIQKRHDKLLDYEFARCNIEKLKDKNLIKTSQDNLNEAQRNYEALNNQLLEELPHLIEKCSIIYEKCFNLYLSTLKTIHERIHNELINLLRKFSFCSTSSPTSVSHLVFNRSTNLFASLELSSSPNISLNRNCEKPTSLALSVNNLENLDTNQAVGGQVGLSRKPSIMSSIQSPKESSKKKSLLFNNPVMQMIKNLKNFDDSETVYKRATSASSSSSTSSAATPAASSSATSGTVQTEEIRERLRKTYRPDDLYKAVTKYSGFGVTSDINIEQNDLVGVIKKADPCGNPMNWFVDNGFVKGIVSSTILKPLNNRESSSVNETASTTSSISSTDSKTKSRIVSGISTISFEDMPPQLASRKAGTLSVIQDEFDEAPTHNYVNGSPGDSLKSHEYCLVLYTFDAIDDSTLSVAEGEKLRILQKHDDNMNDEWWLLEKISTSASFIDPRPRGYVPSNYVELASDNRKSSMKPRESTLNEHKNTDNRESEIEKENDNKRETLSRASSPGNTSQLTENSTSAV